MEYDEKYMRRALQLAASSPEDTHPNPNVGAVIVAPDGEIIGEGWHRRCGTAHAEVNAVASVAASKRHLLGRATMYVTLEPCSHYGKTPPCARLIIETGIRRVVVGAVDPFEKVSGRGIAMLREAGVEVVSGVLAEEAEALCPIFFKAHRLRRPFVTLKLAQSADGYMDRRRASAEEPAAKFSNPYTQTVTHRRRTLHDAILTSAATVMADRPGLDTRLWDGPSPRRVIVDRRGMLPPGYAAARDAILFAPAPLPEAGEWIKCGAELLPTEVVAALYARGITSVLVEGGPRLLQGFIDAGLCDALHVETAPFCLGAEGAHPAPRLPSHICCGADR